MNEKKARKTRKRMISCFAQIVRQEILGYEIAKLSAHAKVKARTFSYESQIYLLMLGQFLHAFSLNELVDLSQIHAKELSRLCGISPANLNTFSHANRTRDPKVMRDFFWLMYNHFRREDKDFIRGKHHGKLGKFKLRRIFAIDSTTISLVHSCIDWAKHRQKKAAVKVHMVANIANRLPHFCVFGKANVHDSKLEEELFNSLRAGDIGIADRAYNCFAALYAQHVRGVFFVVREKEHMRMKVVKKVPKKRLGKNIMSDETIRLTGLKTAEDYPGTFFVLMG